MDGSEGQEGHYYSTKPRRKMTVLPTDSSVAEENMRARLSLVTLTPSAVLRTTCTRTSTRRNTRRGARGHPGLDVNMVF